METARLLVITPYQQICYPVSLSGLLQWTPKPLTTVHTVKNGNQASGQKQISMLSKEEGLLGDLRLSWGPSPK